MNALSEFALLPSDIERERYRTLLTTLGAWRDLFHGRRVLDFGASWGTSMLALSRLGASEVIGVEPDAERVERGRALIGAVAPGLTLLHIEDTSRLPFTNEFEFVLANGVLEHIPQPRDLYIEELWRMVAPSGHLMVNETPNMYSPQEVHTTGLRFNHWLPRRMAHRRATRRGRFAVNRYDWQTSGWRGLSYYELVRPLTGYRLIPERSKLRHRFLGAMGLPASLLDPYPTWILRRV